MLAVDHLISSSKAERVLSGHVLSDTNNNLGFLDLESVHWATIVAASKDDQDKLETDQHKGQVPPKVVGFGLFHKCTANQVLWVGEGRGGGEGERN